MEYQPLIRNVYFDGIREYDPTGRSMQEDMEGFQLPLSQMHYAGLHGSGVVRGLEVEGQPGNNYLTVHPGLALDAAGNLISLSSSGKAETGADPFAGVTRQATVPVTLPLSDHAGKTVYVTIEAFELVRRGSLTPKLEQVPWLRLRLADADTSVPEVDSGTALVLAVAEVDDSGNLTALHDYAPGPSVGRQAIGSQSARIQIRKPYGANNRVHDALAGRIAPIRDGGLEISVPQSTDRVIISGNGSELFGTLTVEAQASHFRGDLEVGGTGTLRGGLSIGSAASPANIDVTGDAAVSGKIAASGLNISGDVRSGGDWHVEGSLSVTGNIVYHGSFQPNSISVGATGDGIDPGPDNVWVKGTVAIGTRSPEGKFHIYTEGPKGGQMTWDSHRLSLKGVNDPDKYLDRLPYIEWRMANSTRAMYLGWGNTAGAKRVDMNLENGFELAIQGGNVGIGTPNPSGSLHVSSKNGWSNPQLRVTQENDGDFGRIVMSAGSSEFHLAVGGPKTGTPNVFHVWSNSSRRNVLSVSSNSNVGIGIEDPDTRLHVVGNRIRLARQGNPKQYIDLRADGAALDLESSMDLVLNGNGNTVYYRKLQQLSSRESKDNISTLTGDEAMSLFQHLTPVRYTYKEDPKQEQQLGFIVEDVPDSVAPDRSGINPMSLVAVLCRVVQEQAEELRLLRGEVHRLGGVIGG